VTGNVAEVTPAATVTFTGTAAAELLLLSSVTTAPPTGAASPRVTVPVEPVPPVTVVGFIEINEIVGGVTVSEVL
jgi:hypothetical protein